MQVKYYFLLVNLLERAIFHNHVTTFPCTGLAVPSWARPASKTLTSMGTTISCLVEVKVHKVSTIFGIQ